MPPQRILSQPFVDANFNFYEKHLGGVAEIKPRWKRCVRADRRLLGEAAGQEYVKRYFPPEAKARAQEMVQQHPRRHGRHHQGPRWMTPETKKKALEKLATFNVKVGYPDKWKDYSSVTVRATPISRTSIAGERFQVADDCAQIGKPVDRGRWGMTPPTSNAYYNPLHERDRVSRRHSAAAGLRRGRRPTR